MCRSNKIDATIGAQKTNTSAPATQAALKAII